MAEIELSNISKFFPDGTQALNNINFTIEDGEFFILVGPSGCGKSTLLNMIVGLEEISSGDIRVDGKIINDLDPKDRNMAMVFQSYALYPHMTVRQNMAFPLTMAKLPKQEIEQRVEQVAEILELSDLLERKPRNLSGGQRQRVAMGRAIVRQPVAFLLDEPLSNLDARLRVQMRTELARLQKRLCTTTIYVTHDQTEAMTLGDRVAVMKDGVVQQVGTPYELYEKPHNLFVAGFIGSPAMNFFPAQIKQGKLYFPGLDINIPIPANAQIDKNTKTLIAGLRPEHFSLEAEDSNNTETQRCHFTIKIDVIEWLGADTLIYFQQQIESPDINSEFLQLSKDNTLNLVARLNAAHKMKENEQLQLSFDPEHLHLFNPASGSNLT